MQQFVPLERVLSDKGIVLSRDSLGVYAQCDMLSIVLLLRGQAQQSSVKVPFSFSDLAEIAPNVQNNAVLRCLC